ncbi:unnamed protein product, partial [Hapterophycus canaliculatus]
GQAEQRPVEVLVPLRKDGSVLGDKIYVPEEFYNELFFEDLGLKVHEALIHRADYRLRLRSINSLDFAMPVQGAAALTVDLAFRRPGSLVRQSTVGPSSRVKSQHRVRLPYQATDVEDVQPIAGAGETSVFQSRRSVRHGRDEKGWLWVEIPDTDIIEIRLTLRCSIETIQQWVTVNAALPSLAVSTLTVQAERRVSSIVLQSPSDSSVGKTGSPSTPFANQLITTDLASTVDPFAYDSQTISLGNLPQLIVRFRVDEQDASAMPWNQPEQWKTRYWVYVQPGETAVECELESLTDLPSQTTVKLSLTNKNVEFLSDGWQLAPEHERVEGDGADQDPAAVPQIELIRHAGRAQPIRLGWKIKTTESGEPITLSLPRVQVGELTSQDDFLSLEPALFNTADNRAPENIDSRARPWIAFSFSKQVQPDWTRIDARAPLSVE